MHINPNDTKDANEFLSCAGLCLAPTKSAIPRIVTVGSSPYKALTVHQNFTEESTTRGSTQTSEEDIIELLQTRILRNKRCYKTLLKMEGAEAQHILNLFQKVARKFQGMYIET